MTHGRNDKSSRSYALKKESRGRAAGRGEAVGADEGVITKARRPKSGCWNYYNNSIIGSMVTVRESDHILAIARINEQIADREASIFTCGDSEELYTFLNELADLHQSKWEREEILKALRHEPAF
jgi:hypothetical protein